MRGMLHQRFGVNRVSFSFILLFGTMLYLVLLLFSIQRLALSVISKQCPNIQHTCHHPS